MQTKINEPGGSWRSIASAPFQKVVEVRNPVMAEAGRTVRATRGYMHNGMVHPDTTFFTSVYTPDEFFGFPAGKLVCPTEWRPLDNGDDLP